MAAVMGSKDQEPGANGKPDERNKGVGKADAIQVQVAALHEELDGGSLGSLEFAKRDARLDCRGRDNCPWGGNAAHDRGL
jgi:hypothetical protein